MKKIKTLLSIIFCAIIAFSGCVTAYANDNIGVSASPSYLNDSGIETYGTSTPKNEWNLISKGKYTFSGTSNYTGLYSNYYFTGVSKVKLYVKNSGKNIMTVSLCKKNILGTVVYSNDVSAGGTLSTTITGLSASSNYYLYFTPCGGSFSGYIQKA